MKLTRLQSFIVGTFAAFLIVASSAVAATIINPAGGGTGTGTKPTDGQLLIGKTSTGKYTPATLTAGSNITITNGSGAITIAASGGGGGSGTTTINGVTTSSFTFSTGTSGSDFNIATSTDTLTFNCPTASGSVRGCLSSANWTTFNSKVDTTVATLSSLASIGTISTGVWHGTAVGAQYGGTGLNTSASTGFLSIVGGAWAVNSTSTQKTLLSLNNVENTALSTWAGSTNLTTLGTISTGVWNGTIITSAYGGTGNGFTKFTGPATSEKTFTLPNASAVILTDNAAVTVAQGGTGQTSYTNGQLLIGNTTGNTLTKATLTGTSNRLGVTNGGGSITLDVSAYIDATEVTATDGATVTFDFSSGPVQKVTLGGNRTFAAPSNLVSGRRYTIRIIQDGTGSRTVSWNSVFKFPGAVAPVLTTTAAAVDVFTFTTDGTNLYNVGYASDVK